MKNMFYSNTRSCYNTVIDQVSIITLYDSLKCNEQQKRNKVNKNNPITDKLKPLTVH